MPSVKGSKQVRMVVVPHRPVRKLAASMGVVFLVALTALGGYFLGQQQALEENIQVRLERDRLQAELQTSTNQLEFLEQALVNVEQAGVIDRQALDDVQAMLVDLQEVNAQLEEDVLFYRQIMSPENDETGLVIGRLDLHATNEHNRFSYRLELKQLTNNDNLISGYANVNVIGIRDREEVSIPLHQLSVSEDLEEIKIQFRYFQNIEGEMIIPDNFSPERVQILAVDQGSNAKTVQKSFSWLVEM